MNTSFFKRTRRKRSESTNSKLGSVESVERSSSDRGSEDGRFPVTCNRVDDEDPRVRQFLYNLREAYTWKERYGSTSDELHDNVKELLRHSTSVQSELAIEGNFDGADRLAKDTEEIKNFCGKDFLDHFEMRTFNREIMTMRPFIITASQYFEPEKVYKDQEKQKLFSFSVAEATTGNLIFKYYLMYTRHDMDCYVLELMTSKGIYLIRPYGVITPSYWSVREDVLYDFSRRTGGGRLGNKIIANLPTRV